VSLRAWIVSILGGAQVAPQDTDFIPLVRPGATPLANSVARVPFAQFRALAGGGSDQGAAGLPAAPAPATTALSDAIIAARAAGKREVRVEGGKTYNVTDETGLLGDALITGDNATFTASSYVQPVPATAPSRMVPFRCIPQIHLRQGRIAAAVPRAVRVVFLGDSVFAGGNILTQVEAQPHQFEEQFRRCNPGVAFTFWNRAIPGATWNRWLDSGPVDQYAPTTGSWAAAAGSQTWVQVVTALQPDIVVVGFGMNPSDAQSCLAGLELIETITPRPDIIVCTNYLPTIRDTSTSVAAFLLPRVRSAGIARAAADLRGHALADINRQQMIAQFGFDPAVTWMERIGQALPRTMPYASPEAAPDAAARVAWSGNIWAGGASGSGLTVQFSSDTAAVLLLDRDAGTGNIAVTGTITGRTWLPRTVTSVEARTVSGIMEVWIKGSMVRVLFPESGAFPGGDIFRGFAPRLGGPFNLTLAQRDLATGLQVATPFAFTVDTLFAGRYQRCRSYLTDAEIHGEDVVNGPIGGGNFNHPTHRAHAEISSAVVQTADLCLT
jgi:hypothetical protein